MKQGPLTRISESGQALTPVAMRIAIFKSIFDRDNTNVIARRCDDAARAAGMNGEDSMTFLAFHALRRVEMLEQQMLDSVYMSINPPVIGVPK